SSGCPPAPAPAPEVGHARRGRWGVEPRRLGGPRARRRGYGGSRSGGGVFSARRTRLRHRIGEAAERVRVDAIDAAVLGVAIRRRGGSGYRGSRCGSGVFDARRTRLRDRIGAAAERVRVDAVLLEIAA
ncbi:hypothetical protein, partial [Nocardia brasiliensis]|uniref:hypothetical protein n=1 Tax=Nocardia brasiliensis TaxID=37326 RepID=UPI002453754C